MIAAGRFVRDALAASKLDTSARLVAFAIASYADASGHATPSSRQLAACTGLHPETIAKAIRRLEAAGIVSVQRRDRRTSRYRFPVGHLATATDAQLSTSARPRTAQMRYPHLRGSGTETARPRTAHLERYASLETHEASDTAGDLFLPGSGWIRQA